MQEYQQRVIDEMAELDEKISKLSTFVDSADKFKNLEIQVRSLMRRQLEVMMLYSSILKARIGTF